MTVEQILDYFADQQGWNEKSQLEICLEYIGRQGDAATFKNFVSRWAEEEKSE